jgi:hypothetical protein
LPDIPARALITPASNKRFSHLRPGFFSKASNWIIRHYTTQCFADAQYIETTVPFVIDKGAGLAFSASILRCIDAFSLCNC